MKNAKVSVFLGLSLDGYIAGPNGELDWLGIVDTKPEEVGYLDLMNSIDCMVLGRNTYNSMLGFDPWPCEGKRVVVMTTQPSESKHGETFFTGALSDLVAQLEQEGIKHIYLDGGNVARQGINERIVNELTLSWLPIILGEGIPLFDETLNRSQWELAFSRSFPSGLVQAMYLPNFDATR